ncbi:MAG: spermidine synthase [Candidatus Omnitrophica bacterium ADurb.Bin205]|mgnify:FL=1|nr:MAG: spermidine synthase [Candidatus Omnitrophica bacterium ADurb.Bin205]
MIIFVLLGIISSIFQLVILREFSFSIAKNELAFILGAGFWIISCSLGSIARLPRKLQDLPLPLIACLSFIISIYLIHLAKLLNGMQYYEAASLKLVLLSSIALIGPTAFITGYIFKYLTLAYLNKNTAQRNTFAKFFAFEALGFFLGGLIFSLYFNNYSNPLIFSILPLLLIAGIKGIFRKTIISFFIIAATLISLRTFSPILQKEFGNSDILLNAGSGYGPIVIARKAYSTMIFSEGSLLATSEDKAAVEEAIHTGLAGINLSGEKDILFIGPALSQEINEIMKYNPGSLDSLHINPLISILSEYTTPYDIRRRVNFITDDPVLYLKETKKKYDAILAISPPPSSLSLNRYFTEDFYRLIKTKLKPAGIFSFSMPSKREILSPQFAKFNSSIINALDKVFNYRLIIPSDTMIIVASPDKEINDYDLIENFIKVNPATDFFTIYHFKDNLKPSARDYIQNRLDAKIPANTSLTPSGFLNYLILEQIKFYPDLKINQGKTGKNIIAALFIFWLLIIAFSFLSKRIYYLLNIGAVGFISIAMTAVIFVLFQAYCGALYWKLGLLIAFFMAGLSTGILIISSKQIYRPKLLSVIFLCWGVAIIALLLSLKKLGVVRYADIIFYSFSLLCGFLSGGVYPVVAQGLLESRMKEKKITTAIYAADLTGAFLGTLACGTLLIPFLGVTGSLISLLILSLTLCARNLWA